MKKSSLGTLTFILLLSQSAQATHFFLCDIEAKIIDVKNLQRLNGVTVFKYGANDFDQMISIEVTRVISQRPVRGCIVKGFKADLLVKEEDIGNYQKDQKLKLQYKNIGSAQGNKITWEEVP